MPKLYRAIKGPRGKVYVTTVSRNPWLCFWSTDAPEPLTTNFEKWLSSQGRSNYTSQPDEFKAFAEARGYTTVPVRVVEVSDES